MKATAFYNEIQNLDKEHNNIELEKNLLALYSEIIIKKVVNL